MNDDTWYVISKQTGDIGGERLTEQVAKDLALRLSKSNPEGCWEAENEL